MLKEEGVQLVVLLEKQYKSVLKYPYTKHFIDDYYVANFDIDEDILPFLKRDIRQYLEKEYVVEDGSLITVYTIYSPQNKPLAYAFMFKNLTELSYAKLDFLIFKWMAFGVILLLVVVMLFDVYLFRRLKKQKMHYKNIINLSTNIVIVHDKQKIIEANKVFFELFSEYDSLDTFNDSHGCVSDFFVLEDGYIQKIMDGKIWIEYLVAHKKQQHKVKLFYKEKLYYFMVSASIIDDTDELYAIVFTDITAEEQYKHELEDKNLQDPLTLIGNRRCFIDSLEHSIATARRYKQPLSLIMCDIDFFKKINDTYGHDVGDEVLIAYTKLIANNLRENDIFCRIGGEEFMIILPHTTKAEASRVAEKLRKIVEEAHEILEITMSFGVSEYRDGEDQKKFLKRVDEAVYTSKENGRNRVSTN
jgi:diguanylate cyclase (GGDEF)-like protein